MFAGSNFDAEDFDDYNVMQRDMQVDGGLRPVTEEDVIRVRHTAGKEMCIRDRGNTVTIIK